MLFLGVVLARAPAAAIFLTHINSVNFVPGLFLALVPELSWKAVTTWFLFQAPLLSVVFIDQTNSWLSMKSWAWCYLLWEPSLAPQADLWHFFLFAPTVSRTCLHYCTHYTVLCVQPCLIYQFANSLRESTVSFRPYITASSLVLCTWKTLNSCKFSEWVNEWVNGIPAIMQWYYNWEL